MLLHLSLVIEILSIIVCIHCIYGEKFKLDPVTVVSFLGILIWLEIVNYYDLNRVYTCGSYILFFIYCKKRFKKNIIATFINFCLFFIILMILQFCGLLVATFLCPGKDDLKFLAGSLITLIACIFLLPIIKIHRLSHIMQRQSKMVLGSVGFVLLFIIIMNVQSKVWLGIQVELYLLMIPMVIGFLYLVYKCCFSQDKVEQIEKEILVVESTKGSYEDLLMSMRLKQHGFKNQLAAILSTQYTYDTYEKIAKSQSRYYEQIVNENKYHELLYLGDYVVSGFLYEKFKEAEADEILVKYEFATQLEHYAIPQYYLVEILGILLDNAVEAMKELKDNRVITVEVKETENEYCFSISNPFRYIPFEELQTWFQEGASSKDMGRGLGLYHVKCLCNQFDCTIGCGNIEKDGMNWINFILKIQKRTM